MPTRTHYYDDGKPLCRLDAVCWNWSVEPRAVSCPECGTLLRDQGHLRPNEGIAHLGTDPGLAQLGTDDGLTPAGRCRPLPRP